MYPDAGNVGVTTEKGLRTRGTRVEHVEAPPTRVNQPEILHTPARQGRNAGASAGKLRLDDPNRAAAVESYSGHKFFLSRKP